MCVGADNYVCFSSYMEKKKKQFSKIYYHILIIKARHKQQ